MTGTLYRSDLRGVRPDHLDEFFEGWPVAPSQARRLAILDAASHVEIAWEEGRVVGFITAITDGTFAAFIPLAEVVADRRGRGIGSELVRRMVERLSHVYSVDLVCDEDVVPFYESLGFITGRGMMLPRRRESVRDES